LIEAQAHASLLAFLRQQRQPHWQHQLTMARLVARALRLGRSTLIQTSSSPETYCLSYLTAALLWPGAVLLVVPAAVQALLLDEVLPALQGSLALDKPVQWGDRWPDSSFQGLFVTHPAAWLGDRLAGGDRFPVGLPVVIDPADDLEDWTRQQLTACWQPADWQRLQQACPGEAEAIREVAVTLEQAVLDRPTNPYNCYLLTEADQTALAALVARLPVNPASAALQELQAREAGDGLLWATLEPGAKGDRVAHRKPCARRVLLHAAPLDVTTVLAPLWAQQPTILIGGWLDWDAEAAIYRRQLGLGELTSVKFSPNRQTEHIQLYLPERLPLPNTPEFKDALIQQLLRLCRGGMLGQHHRPRREPEWLTLARRPAVIIVEDVPLRAQVAAALAAEFGSAVQVESADLSAAGLLICGWQFWRDRQQPLPTPQLLAIATLPLPSLEHPLVAGRVAYHKRQHQDWFRHYLLPTALRELQRAVQPMRSSQGVVALLDSRASRRSYGAQILEALEPLARINYIDWLS